MAILDQGRLERRKHGREQARAVLGLIDLPHPDCKNAFFDELESVLRPKDSGVQGEKRRASIRELSKHVIEFGAHAGKRLDEIPREYLHWLAKSSEETMQALVSYLDATKDQDDHTGT